MLGNVNEVPARLLDALDAGEAVAISSADLGNTVLASSTLEPSALRSVVGLDALAEVRRLQQVQMLTLLVVRLTPGVVDAALHKAPSWHHTALELRKLIRHIPDVFVVYVVTHLNWRPLEELMVSIGGDCYRRDQRDLVGVLGRTRQLASAMIRKAVMVFPEIPALHGGKKGEWIVVHGNGRKVDGLSDEAIIALGSVVIPEGIVFLNRWKELEAIKRGIFSSFPDRYIIRPDTGSPDVLSGKYWTQMCEVWVRRGIDGCYFTCLPGCLGGPLSPSSKPTGYGIATTAIRLAEARFGEKGRKELRFLLEALGGVGQSAVEALIQQHSISPKNITAFDVSGAACESVRQRYHLADVHALDSATFYTSRLPHDGREYDVWINNGLGNDTSPQHIQLLSNAGVRVFCGAANNFLQVETEAHSLERIFGAGGWAWPDVAASGGGWTLAVVDAYTRCQGKRANTPEVERGILDTIVTRNQNFVEGVLRSLAGGSCTGERIWNGITRVIDQRVARTIDRRFRVDEIADQADVRNWPLLRPHEEPQSQVVYSPSEAEVLCRRLSTPVTTTKAT